MSRLLGIILLQGLILKALASVEPASSPTGTAKVLNPIPRVLVCAQVRDQLSEVVEWAEYYYLQGVSQVVVYDDSSSDSLVSLNELYAKHNRSYLKIVPAHWPENKVDTQKTGINGYRFDHLKVWSYRSCVKEYPEADWIVPIDVDEYIWSPKYATLPELLASADVSDDVGSIHVGMVRFGTSGVPDRPKYTMVRTGESMGLLNPGQRKLTVDVNVKRGPDERLGEPAGVLRAQIAACFNASKLPPCDRCNHDCNHKSMVRAKALAPDGLRIHDHVINFGRAETLDINLVRGSHYFFQSKSYIVKKFAESYGRHALVEEYNQVDGFYSAIEDRALQNKYSLLISERLSPLFLDGRL
jgi:hypothetical protein